MGNGHGKTEPRRPGGDNRKVGVRKAPFRGAKRITAGPGGSIHCNADSDARFRRQCRGERQPNVCAVAFRYDRIRSGVIDRNRFELLIEANDMFGRSKFPSTREGIIVFGQREQDALAGLCVGVGNRPNGQGRGAGRRDRKRPDAVGITGARDFVVARDRASLVCCPDAHARRRARGKRLVDGDVDGCILGILGCTRTRTGEAYSVVLGGNADGEPVCIRIDLPILRGKARALGQVYGDPFLDLGVGVLSDAEARNLDLAVRESHATGNTDGIAGGEVGVVFGIRNGDAERNGGRDGIHRRTAGVPHHNNRINASSFGNLNLRYHEPDGVLAHRCRVFQADKMFVRSKFPSSGERIAVFGQREADALAGLVGGVGNRPNGQSRGVGRRDGER